MVLSIKKYYDSNPLFLWFDNLNRCKEILKFSPGNIREKQQSLLYFVPSWPPEIRQLHKASFKSDNPEEKIFSLFVGVAQYLVKTTTPNVEDRLMNAATITAIEQLAPVNIHHLSETNLVTLAQYMQRYILSQLHFTGA